MNPTDEAAIGWPTQAELDADAGFYTDPDEMHEDDADLWPAPVAAVAPTRSRLDRVRDVLRLEGLAAAATARAADVRASLGEEARAELDREGTAPSWRMADIGTVALPLSKEAVVVVDADALVRWVKERYPEQIRTREEIWPGFQTYLLNNCVPLGDVAGDPETGEAVPGLAVRKGGEPKTLTITAAKDVKATFAAYGAVLLDEALAREAGA